MPAEAPKIIVKKALAALRKDQNDSEVVRLIIQCGIEARKAPNVLHSIRVGFAAGTQAAVMHTGMDPDGDNYYRLAFKSGKAALRFASPFWILAKIGLLAACVALAVYLLSRFVF